MAEMKELAEQLVNLTIKEVKELADILKDEHGIEPAAGGAVMMASGPGAGGEGGDGGAEQSEFTVFMNSAGGSKLQVVKTVKELTGLGLKEAKAIVDGSPGPVKEGLSKADAEAMLAKLQEAGADVELK
ncbi:MAG: 50S ribosomal protein L7/L12 [Saprospirales bacterium]|nr:50S ribosomal protein L7/L12 [Saprospirales bacterium]|tara:strand:- start:1827 stop:2213 length:387 start_codon:yes stop_codon:yes gene_type:complete